MPKREALKQKLKAADRRRQRRQVDTQPRPVVASPASTSRVDVAELIVRAILEHVAANRSDARDAMLIAAIKSSLRATVPSGDDAKRLAEKLNEIPAMPGVSIRAFREALQQLLSTANANHDPRSGDAFLRYLSVLSEA